MRLPLNVSSWGTQSPWLVNWIHAQDAVFSNCTGKSPATPSAVPDGSPQLLQADRAYQNAAAAFYAGRFGEAREQFDAIAQDRNSPCFSNGPKWVSPSNS